MTVQNLALYETGGMPVDGYGHVFCIQKNIDFKTDLLGLATAATAYLTYTDTINVMQIPAGAFILCALVRLERKGTLGATTFQLGYTSNATSLMATANLIGVGGTNGTVFQTLYTDTLNFNTMQGLMFTTQNYLLMTPATANFDGRLTFSLIMAMPFDKVTDASTKTLGSN